MPTIVALLLLEATLLRAGPPSIQVCQEILTIIVEEKNMFAINRSYHRVRPHSCHSVSYNTALHSRLYMVSQN